MSLQEDIKAFRRLLELMAGKLDDEQAVTVSTFFPLWTANKTYRVGGRVQHNGLLYRCLTTHTSQTDWEPSVTPSLWVRIDDPIIEWPLWRQPQGAHDSYVKGAQVTHNEKRWVSEVDGNVWEPGVSQWKPEVN